jgi:hypothetical protein
MTAGRHHPSGGSIGGSLALVLRCNHHTPNLTDMTIAAARAEAQSLHLLERHTAELCDATLQKCWSGGPCLISRARVVAHTRPDSARIARPADPIRPPPYPAHSAALTVHPLAPPERATSGPSKRLFALRERHTTLTPGRVSYADLLTRFPSGQPPLLPRSPCANTLREIGTPSY